MALPWLGWQWLLAFVECSPHTLLTTITNVKHFSQTAPKGK